MAAAFTNFFILALILTFGLRTWLAWRQSNNISQHRARVPAEFSAEIPLARHQLAADYNQAKIRLAILSSLVDFGVLLLLTLGGGLNLLWQLSQTLFSQPVLQGVSLIALATCISSLASLPTSLYSTFSIEARFGFNKTTPMLYLLDGIKSIAIGLVIGLPLLALIVWLMHESGSLWWLWVWCVWTGFSLLMLVLYPSVIAPLFNRFSPLQDALLKERIEQLLARTGFKSQGLFVMDGSKRSNHGNAYFTGFGAAKRIVFFDTLIERLQPAEIEAVLAHELGHFKMKHVAKRIGLTFGLALLGLALLGYLIQTPWFFQGLGLHSTGPAQALLLFFMVIPVFLFPLTPLFSLLSRRHEFEADAFAARVARPEDLISALVHLYRDNATTLTPDRWYSAFYDSHPPAAIRITHLKEQIHETV